MVLPSALATGGSYCLFLFFFIHAILPSGYLRHVKSAAAEWCWFCFYCVQSAANFVLRCDQVHAPLLNFEVFQHRQQQWDPGIPKHSQNGSKSRHLLAVPMNVTISFFHCSHPVLSHVRHRPNHPPLWIRETTMACPLTQSALVSVSTHAYGDQVPSVDDFTDFALLLARRRRQ